MRVVLCSPSDSLVLGDEIVCRSPSDEGLKLLVKNVVEDKVDWEVLMKMDVDEDEDVWSTDMGEDVVSGVELTEVLPHLPPVQSRNVVDDEEMVVLLCGP